MRRKAVENKITLPLAAFVTTMLCGTLEPESRGAGANNIPPISQPTLPVSLCAGIDYLTLMYRGQPDVEAQAEVWEGLLGVKFNIMERTLRENNYGSWTRIQGSSGSSFEYKYNPDCSIEYRISGGGQVWGHLSVPELRKCREYHARQSQYRCTRIDLKIDDREGYLCLDTISECLRDRSYKGFVSGEIIESVGGKRAGKTVYFGGRKSIQRMRFYDKAAESGLDAACIRQELQCRGGRASEVYEYIFGGNEDIWPRVVERLISSITFGVRKGKNLERMRVAEFWQKWVEYTKCTIMTPPSLPRLTSVDRTLTWMARSVARSMAKMSELFSPAGLQRFLSFLYLKGQKGMKESEWREVAIWREEQEESSFIDKLFCDAGILEIVV